MIASSSSSAPTEFEVKEGGTMAMGDVVYITPKITDEDVLTSNIQSVLEQRFKNTTNDGYTFNQLRVYANKNIIVDSDIRLPGCHLVLGAEHIEMVGKKELDLSVSQSYHYKTSPRDAVSEPELASELGRPGYHSGSLCIIGTIDNGENWTIKLNGGNGEGGLNGTSGFVHGCYLTESHCRDLENLCNEKIEKRSLGTSMLNIIDMNLKSTEDYEKHKSKGQQSIILRENLNNLQMNCGRPGGLGGMGGQGGVVLGSAKGLKTESTPGQSGDNGLMGKHGFTDVATLCIDVITDGVHNSLTIKNRIVQVQETKMTEGVGRIRNSYEFNEQEINRDYDTWKERNANGRVRANSAQSDVFFSASQILKSSDEVTQRSTDITYSDSMEVVPDISQMKTLLMNQYNSTGGTLGDESVEQEEYAKSGTP